MDQSEQWKKCSSCLQCLPHYLFHKHKSQKDGLQAQCKRCQAGRSHQKALEAAKTRQPYRTNKTEERDGILGKVCFTCKSFKITTDFFKESRNYSGLSGSCKSCELDRRKEAAKKHYEKHHEEALQRARDYVKTNHSAIVSRRRESRKVDVSILHPRYVEKLLKLPKKQITPHLIDLKTQTLQIQRIRKEISTALKKEKS